MTALRDIAVDLRWHSVAVLVRGCETEAAMLEELADGVDVVADLIAARLWSPQAVEPVDIFASPRARVQATAL